MNKIIFKIALALTIALTYSFTLDAQTKRITGIVMGTDGKPLSGITVIISGTSKGVVTDEKGQYSIRADADNVLLFTCLGYKDVSERVENRTRINAVMHESTEQLDETVVIAYGTAKKSDLTGSVSVVRMEDIENSGAFTLDGALQGRVAGVEIISGGGEPGTENSILIRGTRSLSAGNDPLIVVDGIVDAVSNFSEINVQDIASVSVLKDASSTAMYGSRGANGVILVTTKGNTGSKLTISTSASVGVSYLHRRLDLMNATEFAQMRNDLRYMTSYQGSNSMANLPLAPDITGGYPIANPASYGEGTDWIKVITRPAIEQKYHISANWGEQRSSTYMSVAYDDVQGIVIGSGLKRLTTLVKVDRQLFSWLRLKFRGNYFRTNQDHNKVPVSGTSATAATSISPLLNTSSTWNIYGDTSVNGGSIFNNPYMLGNQVTDESAVDYLSLGGSLIFKINKHLNFNTSFTYGNTHKEGYYYSPSSLPVATLRKTGGTAKRTTTLRRTMLLENTLNYDRKIRASHHIKALAGFTLQKLATESKSTSGTGYLDDEVTYWNMGSIVDKRNLTESTSWGEIKRMSFLGRFDYAYRSTYYLTVNGRYDGSSMFSVGKKWGFFPSAAIKWVISNEPFMATAKTSWLSELSIRISAGRSGNDSVSNYIAQSALTNSQSGWIFGDIQQPSYYPTRLENNNLSWEKTDSYNFGIDMSILRNRITIQAEVYKSYTSDLLLSLKNAAQSGFSSRYANIGSTENQGVELSITSHNISKRKFDWTTTFSISHNKQIVTDTGDDFDYITTALNGTQMIYGHAEGYPANSLWGYQFAGVWHNKEELAENEYTKQYVSATYLEGYSKYADINHDGVLDNRDYIYLGSPEPILSGGLMNSFKIWGLNLSIYCTYSLGGKIYNLAEKNLGGSEPTTNYYRYMLDGWHPVRNPNSDIPSARSHDSNYCSRHVHDASFFRIQDVSASYTLNLRKYTKAFRSITFGLSANNLLLLTRYNGYDPDVSSSKTIRRYDGGAYPKPQKVQLSVKLVY